MSSLVKFLSRNGRLNINRPESKVNIFFELVVSIFRSFAHLDLLSFVGISNISKAQY
jgi:hypothetical protein